MRAPSRRRIALRLPAGKRGGGDEGEKRPRFTTNKGKKKRIIKGENSIR